MKLKHRLLILSLSVTLFTFAQAPLPTSYDFTNFNGTIPNTGWTTNIAGTYTYSVGQAGVAGKLDIVGEYVQVNFSGPAGSVNYYIKGWVGSGVPNFIGTFKVQESTDGTTWTDLSVISTISVSAYQLETVVPAAASRYVRFIFTSKNTGNVGLDEISITPKISTQQEINVKQGTSTILNGGNSALFNSAVSTTTPIIFTIENLGTASALTISSVNVTGTNASDFFVSSAPTTVAAASTAPLTINFTPAASGTRKAVLTINNDDADEAPYVINLIGVGGNYATEPIAQGSSLLFPIIKSYRVVGSFSPSAADGYLILRQKSSTPITDVPVDGTSYMRGDNIGSSKVVYCGTDTSFTPNNTIANTTYQFAIFAYNGTEQFINYKQTLPLVGSATTSGSMLPSAEYNGILTASPNFISDLSTKINPHTLITYGDYDETMVRLFAERDTAGDQRVLTCVYSGENYVYTPPLAWGYFSREHTFCHTWMPTYPADASFPELPEYDDQHHLFPTNQDDVNAARSNYPLGEVVTVQSTFMKSKWGMNALGKKVFEPRDEHKGDAARAIMYMCVAYNGISGNIWKLKNPISSAIAYGQDQNILRKWHYQDPPDNWEIARNDFLDSLQGNRNPFIDSAQYACYIDFTTMTKITNAATPCSVTAVSVHEQTNQVNVFVFPNPAQQNIYVSLQAGRTSAAILAVKNILGQTIFSQNIVLTIDATVSEIDLSKVKKGIYFIDITGNQIQHSEKIVVE